jgi:hypothetical protein
MSAQSTLQPPKRPRLTPAIFPTTDAAGIKEHIEKHGFVVVRMLRERECEEAIADQVKNILLKQPWMEKLVVQDRLTGETLDIEQHRDRYIKELVAAGIPKKAREHYHSVWPMHKQFGACCDPNAFHLQTMWNVRQDEDLYETMCYVMGRREIYVDINRCIQKLPGMGMVELLHWDVPVFKPRTGGDFPQMCGKVMFTEGSFVCLPGSHTQEFADEFKAKYRSIYPNATDDAPKFGLDIGKPDPMDLFKRKDSIPIPAGCGIFWSPYLLHGTEKSPLASGVVFGMYLGYMTDIERPDYPAADGELKDRVSSYLNGHLPAAYPSLDPVHYYPHKFDNFQKHMDAYVQKTPVGYEGRAKRLVKSSLKHGSPVYVDILKPVVDPGWVPPVLTERGFKLLGLYGW